VSEKGRKKGWGLQLLLLLVAARMTHHDLIRMPKYGKALMSLKKFKKSQDGHEVLLAGSHAARPW
jgi:hypothetical protein